MNQTPLGDIKVKYVRANMKHLCPLEMSQTLEMSFFQNPSVHYYIQALTLETTFINDPLPKPYHHNSDYIFLC